MVSVSGDVKKSSPHREHYLFQSMARLLLWVVASLPRIIRTVSMYLYYVDLAVLKDLRLVWTGVYQAGDEA